MRTLPQHPQPRCPINGELCTKYSIPEYFETVRCKCAQFLFPTQCDCKKQAHSISINKCPFQEHHITMSFLRSEDL